MSWHDIEANWKQLKSNIQQKWEKLTDDDVEVINGKRDTLTEKIQTTYGVTKEDAHKQVSDWETMLTNIAKPDARVTKESGAKPLPDEED